MAPKKKGGKEKEVGGKADKKPTGPTEEQREELRLKVRTLALSHAGTMPIHESVPHLQPRC